MISVIVPVYNVEAYLPKCIDSIMEQSYADLEIILVDDGSKDSCPAICDRYAQLDQRIKVIHKENGGLSEARNAGLREAHGEYVSFIDSDDYIEPNMYMTMMLQLEQTKADVCICGYDRVDANGDVLTEVTHPEALLSQEDAFEMLVQGNVLFVIACNKLYRRELFDCLQFKVGKIHEDEQIIHHIYGKCKRISVVGYTLYHYLQRSTSIMGTMKKSIKCFDGIEAYIDRAMFFYSIGKECFAGRLHPITIRLFYRIVKSLDNKDINVKNRRNIIRSKIIKSFRKRGLSHLNVIDRISVYLFSLNYGICAVWLMMVKRI